MILDNKYTNFNAAKQFTPISNPGIRFGDLDRGGNIVFIKTLLCKRIRRRRYFEWGISLYSSDAVVVFIYFLPCDSRYYDDESFTEIFSFSASIAKCGKPVFIAGDHNGRFGPLKFANKLYEHNIDTVKNSQGTLLASIYNQCSFYPVNHLYSEGHFCYGDFTFFRGERRSQVDFLFTNNHRDLVHFNLAGVGLELSDHKMITFSLRMKMDLPCNALLKWSKVGHTAEKRLFRVNFCFDGNLLKDVLANNLNDHETYLSSTDFKIENVVENFNTALEKSFLDCKLPKREFGLDDDELNKLGGGGGGG